MPIVLIIEDNPINRDVLGRTARAARLFGALRRGRACRASRRRRACKPDIILMDIGLGELMDGWEATRRIKADPETAAIPIIALTASAFEFDRRKSMAAGCCDFDTKPVDMVRLLSKIENSLRAFT